MDSATSSASSIGLFVKDKDAAITYEEERLKAMGYAQVSTFLCTGAVGQHFRASNMFR